MHYELVSRALAYISCLSCTSLLATTMAMAAVNVGMFLPPSSCPSAACVIAHATPAADMQFGGLTSKAHVEAVAAVLWSKTI
jgi:hypothetical protein